MTLASRDFDFIKALVHRRSAIVLDTGKEYLVESRLLPVARRSGDVTVAALVQRLQRGAAEQLTAQVIEAMTTNETSFFRDLNPFQALRTKILPELIAARAATRQITIWSGACSSGQEAYSIAMTCAEVLEGRPGWTVRIVCTDLNEEMLARVRAGSYSQLEINRGLPAQHMVTWFDRVGTEWVVKPQLRQMIETRPLNLAAPFPPMPSFDVVFLRNVLIYFGTDTKREVLGRVRSTLRPDGWLFLGGAETTLTIDDTFTRVVIDRATAYQCRGGKS